jgi:hypothetical protein
MYAWNCFVGSIVFADSGMDASRPVHEPYAARLSISNCECTSAKEGPRIRWSSGFSLRDLAVVVNGVAGKHRSGDAAQFAI